jgi:hypothetical protein
VPRISAFHGIVIWMYRVDHPPAHFHANHGEDWAVIAIGTGQLLEGDLPPRALRMVREWTRLRRAELEADWQRAHGVGPLERIPPLP